ncbi:MAG: type II toxin-antitoxin system VapC family toxin [Anaerolineales bacterium]|nr:type II toxin-antitoxin system VapC family toxin [Anaerolineales bacterium]
MILLDSDIMIDLLRQHPPAVRWLESLGNEEIGLPGFVVMELLQGCRDKVEQQKVEKLLAGLATVWPGPETCEKALGVFALFHLSHSLGLLDALIGQTAVALDLPLQTFNRKHYAAVPHLQTVEPYTRK